MAYGNDLSTDDPISQQFGVVHDMISPKPKNPKPGSIDTGVPDMLGSGTVTGLVPEATDKGAGNSLTRAMRGMENVTGEKGVGALNAGAGLLGQGVAQFNPSIDYFTKLLSGDQQAMTELMAPETQAIADQYAGAERSAQANLPRGGYQSAVTANLPFEMGRQISDAYLKARPEAATQLAGIANLLAQLGLGQEGVGSQLMAQALQGILGTRGQDVSEHGQAMGMATSLAGDLMGLIKKPAGCWVAAAVYGGWDDPRTILVRAWLNGPFRSTLSGNVAMRVYLAVGRQVAWVARRSGTLRRILRPLFDKALRQAIKRYTSGKE